jgi:hypothetical protein
MPRPMSTAMLDWLNGTVLPIGIFVEAIFLSGPVYLWSGMGSISWNGQTWTGLGAMASVSPVEEGSTVEAKGVTLTLSGFDSALLPDAMNEFALLLPVMIYLVGFNEGEVIANPLLVFSGEMGQPSIEIPGTTASITINCESILVDLDVATDRRYTADDQQRDWPGDLGMNFVNSIQEITIYWGAAPTSTANI